MRTGVTLLIDEGVTLYGARDPSLYEVKTEGATPRPVRHDCSGRAAGGIPCTTATCAQGRVPAIHQY